MVRFVHIRVTLSLSLICRNALLEQLAVEIQDKSSVDVAVYLKVFLKKCKTLSGA